MKSKKTVSVIVAVILAVCCAAALSTFAFAAEGAADTSAVNNIIGSVALNAREYFSALGEAVLESVTHTDVDGDLGTSQEDMWEETTENLPVQANGTCGDNLTWTLDDGVLTISGTGEMENYTWDDDKANPWYSYRNNITSVVISDGIIRIGDQAFVSCRNLTNVNIPDSVTSIGGYAFSGCSSLTSIDIPDRVTNIGSFAFARCSSLKNITVPASVSRFPNFLFENCLNLESITILNKECDNINSIPEETTIIGYPDSTAQEYAEKNDMLFKVYCLHENTAECEVIEATCEKSGYTAGTYCTDCGEYVDGHVRTPLLEHTDENSDEICDICEDSTVIIAEGTNGNMVTWRLSSSGKLLIDGEGWIKSVDYFNDEHPEWHPYRDSIITVVINEGITAVGDFSFYGYGNITSVSLPDGISFIGNSAFNDCTNLKSIVLPDSVRIINNSAFGGCSSLTSINIPDGVTSIENSTFNGCSSLVSIDIPDSVTSIGGFAFYDCSSLVSIDIPDSVTNIELYTFSGCSSLVSIDIPDCVTKIGDYAFSGCSSLESVVLPAELITLDEIVFNGCVNLHSYSISKNNPNYSTDTHGVLLNKNKTILICYPAGNSATSYTVPDTVTSISDYAFSACKKLTSINLHDKITSIGKFGFSDCTRLKNIELPGSITSISDNIFWNCLNLESVYISGCVESIGNYAFKKCSSLGSINIPDSVTSIGGGAFEECSNLESIDIPEGVQSIGTWTFYNCSALNRISLPDGLKSIGSNAFSRCIALSHIDIPDGVESIGDSAFNRCSALTSINIPDGVKSIESRTFSDCDSLKNVDIPYGVTTIGSDAFSNCDNLKSVNIPDSVTNVGSAAFSACIRLESLTFPASVTSITYPNWGDCYNLEYITVLNKDCDIRTGWYSTTARKPVLCGYENSTLQAIAEEYEYEFKVYCPHENTTEREAKTATCALSGNTSGTQCDDCGEWLTGNEIVVPHTDKNTDHVCDTCLNAIGSVSESGTCGESVNWTLYDDSTMYITGTGAMANGKIETENTVKRVVVDSGVTTVGNNAFDHYYYLESAVLANGVTSIGQSAFYCCFRLESIDIPDTVTIIRREAFDNCRWLEEVVIPDGVTSIEYHTFWLCFRLKKLVIPDSVTKIGSQALGDCCSLETLDLPENLTTIGEYAFSSCSGLTSIEIPDKVETIGYNAFSGCSSLRNVDIPDSVTSIGYEAFMDCTNLISVSIPSSVEYFGRGVFEGCKNLRQFNLPDNADIYTSVFEGCSNIESVEIPKNATQIGERAFEDCVRIASINIPDSVKWIYRQAFYGCIMLKNIEIPKSVVSIGSGAFCGCNALTKITILNPSCTIYDSSSTIPETAVIKGYEGSTAQAYAEKYGRKFEAIPLVCPHANTTEYDAVAATCTTDGYTAGTYCEDCETWIDGHTVQTSPGHSYTTVIKKATTSQNGSVEDKCENCGDVRSKKTIYKAEAFSLSTDEYTYNGKTKSPRVNVADYKGNALVEGTDFSVDYTTDCKSVGEHKVTVTLKGNYSGKKTLTFVILPKATSRIDVESKTKTLYIDWARVTGADGYRVYVHKGSKQVLAKNVTDCDYTAKELETGTKYKVTVKAYFVVDGDKVYADKTLSVYTATKPSKVTLSSVTAGTKLAKLKWEETECTSYQIRYSTDKNFGSYETVTVKGEDSVSKTIKSLKSGKTYYFKVRAYKSVDGVKYYGSFSTVKSVKVK